MYVTARYTVYRFKVKVSPKSQGQFDFFLFCHFKTIYLVFLLQFFIPDGYPPPPPSSSISTNIL